MVRPMGANIGNAEALISIRGPPMRLSTSSDTWDSVLRTAFGGSDPPSSNPDIPIAVGTQAGYRTWT